MTMHTQTHDAVAAVSNPPLRKRPSTNELPRLLLEKDYAECQEILRGKEITLALADNSNLFHWKLEIEGGRGSLWTGKYM